jgi:hypothetical protein
MTQFRGGLQPPLKPIYSGIVFVFVLVLPGCQLMDDSPKIPWVCFF